MVSGTCEASITSSTALIDPVPITSVVRCLRWIVLATRLIKQLIGVIVVVVFHGPLHLFLEGALDPLLS